MPSFFLPQHKTGLPISTYFSAVKLRWLMDNVDEVRDAVVSHRAMFGTVDSWLIWVRNAVPTSARFCVCVCVLMLDVPSVLDGGEDGRCALHRRD